MRLRWTVPAVIAAALAWAGDYMAGHPYGDRFALGIWPVPSGTPWSYQLESGFVPALTVVSLATLIGGAWHHLNCHEAGCWRPGKHKVDGTPWCNRHHSRARERTQATLEDVVARLDLLLAAVTAAGKGQP